MFKDERGMANIEAMIITGCFVIIIIIASLAMFGQGGKDEVDVAEAIATIESNIEANMETAIEEASEAKEIIAQEAHEYLCELDYSNGLTNVVQYQECLGNCSE